MPSVFDTPGRIHFARALLQNFTRSIVGIPTSILPTKFDIVSCGVNMRATASWWNWWYVCWIPDTWTQLNWYFSSWLLKHKFLGRIQTFYINLIAISLSFPFIYGIWHFYKRIYNSCLIRLHLCQIQNISYWEKMA